MGISIKTESKMAQASFTIEGLSKDVLQATTEIHKMLTKVKDEEELKRNVELASTVADWQYQQQAFQFQSFDSMTNFKLEQALDKKLPNVKVTVQGQVYTVTMPSGPATDGKGQTLQIKRVDRLKDEDIPEHWNPMPANTPCLAVPINAGTTEYNEILKMFQASCNRTVITIERIQNPVLWKSLQIKKRDMEQRNGHQNNEKRLFHGTCYTTVNLINEHGFNRSYAGKNATALGHGTYFAVNASYSASNTYSRPNQNQEKFMYLCRVLTGDYTQGQQNMIVPPAKGSSTTQKYDSVVDNQANPSMCAYLCFGSFKPGSFKTTTAHFTTTPTIHPSGPAEGAGLGESLSIHGSTEKLSSSAVNRILMEFLVYFGRAVFVFYPVYLTGYLGLSISWVLLCMVMITWWKKNRQWKDARIGTAIDFVDNETHVVNKELHNTLQMASWVLQQAWPFFGMFMEKLLKENIQPTVRLSSPALKMFTFTKVHFGHIPLKITGMKVYTHEVDQKEVILDMNISYEGDVDIDAEVKPPITAGIKGLKLKGMIRVILEPLIGQVPLVGGVTFFFIRRPTLEINWTGMTNLLDSPAFSSLSEDTIMDIIASLMVLPNRMCFPLIDQVKVDQMRFPLPRGVVRVHLIEARDLVAKDTYMLGMVKGKSDPYATVRVGNRHFKSKTIKENLNPIWKEVHEFVIHEAPGQELEVELYDEDTDKDDFLGRYHLDLGEVKREKEIDQASKKRSSSQAQWLSLKRENGPNLLVVADVA
ncbi:extended synaptotagmin-3-like protein [Lates japonicus]|uniref:Poly [ADP-ribose] polymerase n=1 Tax=Lates japonicus TaxID=270547 RepID=A0AAD3R8P4_LATJO|nr:extended synaptotagmin-3-like protein [Lates japonicus]